MVGRPIIRQQQQVEEQFTPFPMQSTVDNLRMRDSAGLEGKEVARISKGEGILFLGEISDFTTKIKLRGIDFDEPWLKVKAKDKEGWVYAGGIKFDMEGEGKAVKRKIITARLKKFFGTGVGNRIESYQGDFEAIENEKDFKKVLDEAVYIQDTLNRIIDKKLSLYELDEKLGYENLPDLFWIDDAIPAMQLETVAEGTEYYLFIDYGDFVDKAANSDGDLDDDFMDLTLTIYEDSVEYFFPSWYLQTWDYGGFSLLGSGKHRAILDKMEALSEKGDLFKKDVKNYKTELLRDITEGKEYGYSQDKILEEMGIIIAKDYAFLLRGDVIAIKNRRNMFQNPEEYEIQFNMRDGM